MARIIVLGAGVMGLAAAHRALTLGHSVTLLEASAEPGGMAAHFDLAGLSIERYYHFVYKSDRPTFQLLAELGIGEKMRWQATSMAYFIGGRLHRWGDPIALLRFPLLSFVEKLCYGVLIFVATRRGAWPALETMSAKHWIERWCGRRVYRTLWQRLFDLKFHQFADNISAAWIRARIRRAGRSRRSLMQQELGYIDGGSLTLIDALGAAIVAMGGEIRLATPATRIAVENGRVTGVAAGPELLLCDQVISTVPTPLISRLVPDLPPDIRAAYDAIENIGVICVVLKLRRPVTPHVWVNIVDPAMPIPGIIEFSNLRRPATGDTVVYVPYYMPTGNPLWERRDDEFVAEAMACLQRINPSLTKTDLIAWHVGRLRHAQPICPPGFAARIPPVQTAIAGLQIADTCFYYPEDRGLAESIRLGRAMADAIGPSPARADKTSLRRAETRRFVTFLATGGAAAAVNIGTRWLLSTVMPYAAAVAVAYLVGMAVAFVLARRFVFDHGGGKLAGQFARFATVNAVAFAQVWLVSVGLAKLLFPALGVIPRADTVAHVIGVLSPVATSYVLHNRFSFRKRP
jgi:protoporphyrinogen oxidase/putative flippase GtrA